MGPEVLSIVILAAMFVVATVLPVNMGALAFVGAFVLGVFVLGMDTDQILEAFPGGLFLTIVGVTYLFAIAQKNGTVDLLVQGAVRLVGSRVALIPWIMFLITAVITAVGALSPAAVAIIAPIALSFAAKYRINPLMMGMMVIHGAQGGGFSPIAVYGVTVNGIVAESGLDVSPTAVFLSSLVFNLLIAVGLFLVLGGRGLLSARAEDFVERASEARLARSRIAHGGDKDVDFKGFGSGMYGPTDPAGSSEAPARREGLGPQVATIIGLVVLAVVALGFGVDVGFVAITIAVLLALVSPQAQKGAVNKIDWSTVLLLAGMLTFVGVLQEAGTIEYVSNGVAGMGVPLLAALLICYIGAVVSAFASSTAILAALIPLAVPFLLSGQIGAAGLICALAVSSTIVDVSPFSTNGALVLANAPESMDRDRFYKQILVYATGVVVIGPLLAWGVMVAPGWL
ncbi:MULTISPECIES: SLC13 family permease [Kocuria]|jgi:di/tricarboxylate transporter|uniref:SLC13 family permease n=1 Tax=Kocuria TaxID=57493 RepID=UPI00203ED347|nr:MULTISPECIES: SLC13 family permease [Kocuria]MCM3687143.1 SLC13 family permease [Kocuria rosea]HST71886.1 SLC13 family permease [Kocuria rosea]